MITLHFTKCVGKLHPLLHVQVYGDKYKNVGVDHVFKKQTFPDPYFWLGDSYKKSSNMILVLNITEQILVFNLQA